MSEPESVWSVRDRRTGYGRLGTLWAYWEVSGDPISDDYRPGEILAADLLRLWMDQAKDRYPTGLVPIHWSVESEEQGVFEYIPFQLRHIPEMPKEDFLTFFEWPVNVSTGGRLNWPALPVRDKLWDERHADKGGFVQQATGWKPAILQPHVYLPSLAGALQT